MTIGVSLDGVASNNSASAVKREAWRLVSLAWCMRRLGEDVRLSRQVVFDNAEKQRLCKSIPVGSGSLLVGPERICGHPNAVVVKTSMGTQQDQALADRSKVLVAHNYDPRIDQHPSLLPIPLMIHDVAMDCLGEHGLLEAYLCNDLDAIRREFVGHKSIDVGFLGDGSNGRDECVEHIRDLCDVRFERVPAEDYLRWSAQCVGCLNLPGVRPKCYRFAEMALIGVVNCGVQMPLRITPALTDSNSVIMKTWSDRDSLIQGITQASTIRRAADASYVDGWSPMGQAKLILERL